MTTQDSQQPEPTIDDLTSELQDADPADAPEVAEELARRLGAQLDDVDDGAGGDS